MQTDKPDYQAMYRKAQASRQHCDRCAAIRATIERQMTSRLSALAVLFVLTVVLTLIP